MPQLFEPERVYQIASSDEVSELGRQRITRYVRDIIRRWPYSDDFHGWALVNNQGKIAKRISKYVYKSHNIKLDSQQVSQIGNLANQYTVRFEGGQFIISREMDIWRGKGRVKADHADQTCFSRRSYNHHHWIAMSYNDDYYVLRTYDRECEEGLGRAWVKDEGNRLVIFNLYSRNFNYQQLGIGMAESLGVAHMAMGTCKNRDIYLNSAPILIGDEVKDGDGFELRLDPDRYRCPICRNYTDPRERKVYKDGLGIYWCEPCYVEEGCSFGEEAELERSVQNA